MDLPDARRLSPESLVLVRKIAVRAVTELVTELGLTNKDAAAIVGVGENAVRKMPSGSGARPIAKRVEKGEEGLLVKPQGRPEGTSRSLAGASPEPRA